MFVLKVHQTLVVGLFPSFQKYPNCFGNDQTTLQTVQMMLDLQTYQTYTFLQRYTYSF